MRTILTWGVLAGALVVTGAACGGEGTGGDERPLVVVTTTILGDVVEHVAGGTARVEVLVPPGTDPHEYAPSASDAARLHDADLVVTNGLGLETGLADVLGALPEVAILVVGDAVDPMYFLNGVPDPHFWFDPARMAVAVGVIRDALLTVAPEGAEVIVASAAAYQAELANLDDEVAATLAAIPRQHRLLVANHAFLGYFADRYGLEVVGSVIPGGSTVEEPVAAAIAALADTVERRGVRAVFAEASESTRLAEALAAEAGGLPVVVLLSGAIPDGGSYTELITTDAALIADALK